MRLPVQFSRSEARRVRCLSVRSLAVGAAVLLSAAGTRAAELVTLTNGFDLVCEHHENVGQRVRLYLTQGNSNFVEFGAVEIAAIETGPVQGPVQRSAALVADKAARPLGDEKMASLTGAELHEMLAAAGAQHNIDVDLLASVVHAESGGNARAVSRTGARGLMQLMPGTAADMGVSDSFRPEENIRGGVAYLDSLLSTYRDNLALALAAYNAGPAAVARWHGVPPYRETRAYVARVIREFNARSLTDRRAAAMSTAQKQMVASR